MENAGPRLIDEFRAEVAARGVALPGELDVVGSFADFDPWPGDGDDIEGIIARADLDPAFAVMGYSRWAVFGRVHGQIRYYAAALAGPRGDEVRRATILAESEYSELGILTSVADAVTLSVEYLNGKPLREIGIRRLPSPWGFPDPEPEPG